MHKISSCFRKWFLIFLSSSLYLQVDFAEAFNNSDYNDDESNVVGLNISFVLGLNWKTVTLEGKIFSAVNSFLTASSKEIRQLMVSVEPIEQ